MKSKMLMALLGIAFSGLVFADCVEEDKTAKKSPTFLEHVAASSSGNTSADAVSFTVSKMSCKSCAAKIRKALKTELGIENVEIDIGAKTVTVNCPSASCSKDNVAATLAGAGYPPTPSL